MGRISKQRTKQHNQAVELLSGDKPLSFDDRFFVINNWTPIADHNVSWNAAFFTPMGIARDMQIEINFKDNMRILDLCAGIGGLSLQSLIASGSYSGIDITCIEFNPAFVEIGKRVLPEATWIRADAFDKATYEDLEKFDVVISNPPYGLKTRNDWLTKSPSQFQAAEVAMKMANYVVFVLLQGDCPFSYSGQPQGYRYTPNPAYEKWSARTGIQFEMNCGIDTSFYKNDWEGVKMDFEIVNVSKIPFELEG